ncbi:hypothetical protein ACWDA9_33770, partial [Streptomyces sp. NPDC001193]
IFAPGSSITSSWGTGDTATNTISGKQQPVARTVAVRHTGDSWRWCLDEEYWPVEEFGPTSDSGGQA